MIRSLFLCGLLFIPTVVTAQDARSDSKPFQINDWCEPQTVVAGRVSLKNLDIAGAIDQVIAMAPQMDPAETSAAIPAKGLSMAIMRSIMDSGVNDVYITLSVTDLLGTNSLNPFSPTPVFWLPTPDPAKTAAVVNVFFSQFPAKGTYVLKSIPGAVVLGPANTLARIEQGRVSNRTDLTKALETIDDWTLTVQASLPEATREEVAAIWPAQLPAPVEFVSPKQLIQTVHSLTFQSRLGKQLAFQLAANCADAKAAQSTHQTLEKAMTLLPPEFPKLSTTLESQRVMISVSNEQLANIFRGAFGAATVAQAASAETNQLRQIILAMHNFAESYKFLPPRETRLPDATPLLSWRVHLLPYLGELALYQQFHLNEPWDSEHNKALITKMPSVYVTDKALAAKGLTQFAAPTLSGSLWSGNDKPLYFDKVTDGTSITIAIWIAPAESAVIWTKPSEPQLDDNNLVKQFFGDRETVAIGVLDGSVRTITSASDPATLKAAITIGGGEVFDFEDLSK